MSFKILSTLTLSVCAFLFSAESGAQEMRDSATGKSFPREITIQYEGKSYFLKGTGVSTRKKFFAKVYSVAHYMSDPLEPVSRDHFQQVLDAKAIKQLTSIWVRDVGAKKVKDGYRESINNALSKGESKELGSIIDQYLSFFGDVKNNDVHVVRWFPDGTVTVQINGTEKGSVKNPRFARALWSVWFGQKSVVKRDQLVQYL